MTFKFILFMNKFNNQQKIKQNKYINNFLMKQITVIINTALALHL